MKNIIFVLGPKSPVMDMIETLLGDCGQKVVHAFCLKGRYLTDEDDRVNASNAYTANAAVGVDYTWTLQRLQSLEVEGTTTIYLVECNIPTLRGVVRIDHHRPSDPGYGKPAEEFLPASSIGQVIALLARKTKLTEDFLRTGRYVHPSERKFRLQPWRLSQSAHDCTADGWSGTYVVMSNEGEVYAVPQEYVLAVAADHCLTAAYRGECPGVDPDKLMRWRIASRAKFQNRSEEEVLADVEHAREVLRLAVKRIVVADKQQGVHPVSNVAYLLKGQCRKCGAFDMPGTCQTCDFGPIPELPEAAAREGIAYLVTTAEDCGECLHSSGELDRLACRRCGGTGKVSKTVLGSASPEQVDWFLREYPAQNKKGDPAQGWAEGYE